MPNKIQIPKSKPLSALIVFIIVFSPALYLLRFSILGVPTTVLEIGIYLLFIFYFLIINFDRAKLILPDRSWLWPIGLFVAGAVVGVIVTPDKRVALGQLKGFVFDPILFGWMLYAAIRAELISPRLVVNSLVASGVLIGIGSLLLPKDISGRALSIYAYDINPSANYVALYLSPLATVSVVRGLEKLVRKENGQGLLIDFASGLLMVVSLFLSGSRGGLLGLGVGVLVGLIILAKTKTLKFVLAFLTFLTILTIFWLAKPDLTARPDSGRIASSNNIRFEIWATTKEILTKNPRNFLFGIGLGNYQRYFTELTQGRVNYPEFIAPRALTPHNIFLAMWVNGGLVMLVGFVWILALYFKSLALTTHRNPNNKFQMTNQIQNPNDKNLALSHSSLSGHSEFGISHFNILLVVAMVALLTHGLVDTPYFKNDLGVEFWVLIALSSVIRRYKNPIDEYRAMEQI